LEVAFDDVGEDIDEDVKLGEVGSMKSGSVFGGRETGRCLDQITFMAFLRGYAVLASDRFRYCARGRETGRLGDLGIIRRGVLRVHVSGTAVRVSLLLRERVGSGSEWC
jgi:hypothetical protein